MNAISSTPDIVESDTVENQSREAENLDTPPIQDAQEPIEAPDGHTAEDVSHLRSIFPELQQLEDVSELNNSARYSELRSLGLTPEEAYLATKKRESVYDNRSHLVSAVPTAAHSPKGMTRRELGVARELFSDLSDNEIQKLYQKVTR